MTTLVRRLSRDQRGATAVEYGLILAVVVIAILVALAGVAGENTALWTGTAERTRAATAGTGN